MDHPQDEELSATQLRQFGLLLGGMTALLFGLVPKLFGSTSWPLWPWLTAFFFAAWGLAWPRGLGPVYRGWMRIGVVLGWINTRILLFIIYCLLIVPTGVFLRLRGIDPLARRLERGATTYRVPSRQNDKGNMEAPY